MAVGYVSIVVRQMSSEWTRKARKLSFDIRKIAWYVAGAL
jgi:hypothetical protein